MNIGNFLYIFKYVIKIWRGNGDIKRHCFENFQLKNISGRIHSLFNSNNFFIEVVIRIEFKLIQTQKKAAIIWHRKRSSLCFFMSQDYPFFLCHNVSLFCSSLFKYQSGERTNSIEQIHIFFLSNNIAVENIQSTKHGQ